MWQRLTASFLLCDMTEEFLIYWCVCVSTCLCVYVSAKNMLCHGIASWARALFTDRGSAVCSGNTGVTDHYTTLIMLSVNSRCKYPGKHIGPSGEHAHITQTHTVVASHKFCQTRAVRWTASVTMCVCHPNNLCWINTLGGTECTSVVRLLF